MHYTFPYSGTEIEMLQLLELKDAGGGWRQGDGGVSPGTVELIRVRVNSRKQVFFPEPINCPNTIDTYSISKEIQQQLRHLPYKFTTH